MRTFIAIELPGTLLAPVEQLQGAVQGALDASGAGRAIRWTPAHNVHLTLRFLGETSPSQIQSLSAKLTAMTGQHAPFVVELDRLGCFPDYRQPRIVWLDLQGALSTLAEMHARAEQAAVAAGFAAETRAFQPHLTIGRARRAVDRNTLRLAGEALRTMAHSSEAQFLPSPTTFSVTEIVHLRSDLRPEGAEYTAIARFPFGCIQNELP